MPRIVVWQTAALGLVMSLFAADASAASGSAVCRGLEAQLSRSGGNVSSASSKKYLAAIQRQRKEITKARGMLRSAGCGFFAVGGQCAGLNAKVRSMERNLASLERNYSRLGGGGRQSNARIMAALKANKCRENGGAVVASRGPGLLEQLFGGSRSEGGAKIIRQRATSRGASRDRVVPDSQSIYVGEAGKYRTYCVRSCDGYYFPMSPSSSRDDFARDEQNCQVACPGASMEVYFHKDGDEEAGLMVSANSGELYENMSVAFNYREQDSTPQCGCGARPMAVQPARREVAAPAPPPTPKWRPDPATDPETLANADGGFGLETMRGLLSGRSDGVVNKRRVRVVGPVFLPDQTTAEAPQAPGPTEVR